MFKLVLVLLTVTTFSLVSFGRGILPVGVYLSTTGTVAVWGRLEWEGIEIAHSMVSKVGSKKIKLVLEDTSSKPEGAALAAENLINRGIKFVVGPVTTSNALAALPIFERKGVVDVIPTANGMGLIKNRKFASRVCLTNDVQAKIMADFICSSGRYRRGVVVEDISNDYSIDLAHRFIKDFEKDGGKILRVYKTQFMQKDFTALATHIKYLDPDFVYITSYYNQIALFLRDLRNIGCKVKVFAGSAASSYALIKIAGKDAEGLIFTDDFDPLLQQNAKAKRFVALFEKKFHRLPDSPEALAADAYLLLVKAIKIEGENPKKVANFVRNTTFYGITGKIIITHGNVKRTVVLREVKDGIFQPVAIYEP